MYEEDVDDEEEEVCHLRCNNEKVKEKTSKNEELTENECEQECFNLLIDEHAWNNLHNVCLHNLTHEEDKFLQEEVKEDSKHWKEKMYVEKSTKAEEVTKVAR